MRCRITVPGFEDAVVLIEEVISVSALPFDVSSDDFLFGFSATILLNKAFIRHDVGLVVLTLALALVVDLYRPVDAPRHELARGAIRPRYFDFFNFRQLA